MNEFPKLTKALSDMGAAELELVPVDVDGSPDVYQLPELKTLFGGVVNAPVGAGEAAFCRDGSVVHAAFIRSGHDPNEYYFNATEFPSSFGGERPKQLHNLLRMSPELAGAGSEPKVV